MGKPRCVYSVKTICLDYMEIWQVSAISLETRSFLKVFSLFES